MKKFLIALFVYQIIFCNCGSSQQTTSNFNGWENFQAEHYDDSKYIEILDYDRFDLRPDSIYFYAKYKPSEILENLKFGFSSSILMTYMSATKQEHYDTIFARGEAPVINPDFKRGRYNDKLLVHSSVKNRFNNIEYEIVRVEQILHNQTTATTEIFAFRKKIINDRGKVQYKMISVVPPKLDILISIVKQVNSKAGYYLFSAYPIEGEEEPPAVTELKEFAFSKKGNSIDLGRFNFLINKWKANGDLQKINSIY